MIKCSSCLVPRTLQLCRVRTEKDGLISPYILHLLPASGVMEKLADYYSNFGTIAYKEFSLPAVHSQVCKGSHETVLQVT